MSLFDSTTPGADRSCHGRAVFSGGGVIIPVTCIMNDAYCSRRNRSLVIPSHAGMYQSAFARSRMRPSASVSDGW